MIFLIHTNHKKKNLKKERQIVSMHIRLNKTHLSNVIFAKSTRVSIRFPKLNETYEIV